MNRRLTALSTTALARLAITDDKALADDPRRDIRVGAIVAATFLVVLVGWGSLAPLDAAAVAPGEITVAGHRQTVQHQQGGVISAIDVKEGQKVKAGQVLIELAGADTRADEQALSDEVIQLEAQKARLEAEELGSASITWPADFTGLTGTDAAAAAKAETIEAAQFHAHAADLAEQKAVLGQKTSELGEVVRGYRSQIGATDREQALLGQELSGLESLAARGYAPLNKVRDLQRSQAELSGQRGQYLASVAQSQQEAQETQLEISQVDKTEGDKVAGELDEVVTSLGEALPKLAAAKDALARTEIRAPVSGSVLGLSVSTVGGVIAPGQKLMDIVPDRAPLLIEARFSPADVQDLKAGDKAEVRFPTIHDRNAPILQGVVDEISADSLADPKTGARYFTAEISVPLAQLDAAERRRDPSFDLRPGMPAQVLVPVRKRTALEYLLGPLGDVLWGSFRES